MPVSIRIDNLSETIGEVNAEVQEAINELTVAATLNAVTALREATPVDTGRARSSWNISDNRRDFRNSTTQISNANLLVSTAISTRNRRSHRVEPVELYITNGVAYIDELNAGKSTQAPSRFIEKTLLEFYEPDGAIVEYIDLPGRDET